MHPLVYGAIDEFLTNLSSATTDDALQVFDALDSLAIDQLLGTPDRVLKMTIQIVILAATRAMLSAIHAERGRPLAVLRSESPLASIVLISRFNELLFRFLVGNSVII